MKKQYKKRCLACTLNFVVVQNPNHAAICPRCERELNKSLMDMDITPEKIYPKTPVDEEL